MAIGKDGRGDITRVTMKNQHTRKCCAINGVDVNTYKYDCKRTPFQDITSATSNFIPNSTANSSNFNISPNKKAKPQQFNDVSIEARIRTKELATENLGWLPAKIWMTLKGELDKKYDTSKGLGGWSGIREDQVKSLVKDARAELGLGDAISTVMDVPQYSQMKDTDRPFVQYSSTMPNPQKKGKIIQNSNDGVWESISLRIVESTAGGFICGCDVQLLPESFSAVDYHGIQSRDEFICTCCVHPHDT